MLNFKVRGLASGEVVLRFGLLPTKSERDAFGVVLNYIKKYTVEVRVFPHTMGLSPATSPATKETGKEADRKAIRRQLIAQEQRRRAESFVDARKKMDWMFASTPTE